MGGLALIGIVESERPSLETVVTWIEWETILLISGMMIIVAVFCETGLFDLIAVRLFHYAGTRIWVMIGLLCTLSAILSAVLDNVTTILLLIPITIRLCEVMQLDPKNIIIGIVVFSNIGGCSTGINNLFIKKVFKSHNRSKKLSKYIHRKLCKNYRKLGTTSLKWVRIPNRLSEFIFIQKIKT